MSFVAGHLLNVVIFLPLLFAGYVFVLPGSEKSQIRGATFIGMLVTSAATVWLFLEFDANGPEFQFVKSSDWIPQLGIRYHVGVDGLSASLVLLTGILGPLVVLGSLSSIENRVKEFHLALLILQTAMLGTLASLDLILFYVFWEAMLVPMYLLIGVWGTEDRVMAAMKFFLYTLVGSFLMLLAILAVYFVSKPAGFRTFDYAGIYNGLIAANSEVSACLSNSIRCDGLSRLGNSLHQYGPWMFAAFALAFAVKVPMFPVHTWLPDAHVQAPMAGSMILAGVMLKMGTYGFWRFAIPLFPAATRQFRPILVALAVIGIVYGALMCLAQRDVKKLIAYSSVSHLGYCMLGMLALTVEGASGAAYQMLNHGISTGALFLLFGLLYERRHKRLISDYGGIAKVMPVFAAFFLIITFSSIGVPGTNGFVGEFLVLLGTFKSSLPLAAGVFAAAAVILGAAYMLWMVQRVFFGPLSNPLNRVLPDLSVREIVTVVPLVFLALGMGLLPKPFLSKINPASQRLVARGTLGLPGSQGGEEIRIPGEVPSEMGKRSAPPGRAISRAGELIPVPSARAINGIRR